MPEDKIALDPRVSFVRHNIAWNCIDYRQPAINEFVVHDNTVVRVTIPYPHYCVIVEHVSAFVECPKGIPCKVRDSNDEPWLDAILYYVNPDLDGYLAVPTTHEDGSEIPKDERCHEWFAFCEIQPSTSSLDNIPSLTGTISPEEDIYVPVPNDISFPYIQCRYKSHAHHTWDKGILVGVQWLDEDGNEAIDKYLIIDGDNMIVDDDGDANIFSTRYCEILQIQSKNIRL